MKVSKGLVTLSLHRDACTSVPKVYIRTTGMATLFQTIHEALKGI